MFPFVCFLIAAVLFLVGAFFGDTSKWSVSLPLLAAGLVALGLAFENSKRPWRPQ